MGEKKDVRRVEKRIKKLERAVRKGHVNKLQRKFAAITDALKVGALQPPKLFKDIEMRDYAEGSGEDGKS